MSDPVGRAKADHRAALTFVARQVEHARDSLAAEHFLQAQIHLEVAAQAANEVIRTKQRLEQAVKRAANAVPYA